MSRQSNSARKDIKKFIVQDRIMKSRVLKTTHSTTISSVLTSNYTSGSENQSFAKGINKRKAVKVKIEQQEQGSSGGDDGSSECEENSNNMQSSQESGCKFYHRITNNNNHSKTTSSKARKGNHFVVVQDVQITRSQSQKKPFNMTPVPLVPIHKSNSMTRLGKKEPHMVHFRINKNVNKHQIGESAPFIRSISSSLRSRHQLLEIIGEVEESE